MMAVVDGLRGGKVVFTLVCVRRCGEVENCIVDMPGVFFSFKLSHQQREAWEGSVSAVPRLEWTRIGILPRVLYLIRYFRRHHCSAQISLYRVKM